MSSIAEGRPLRSRSYIETAAPKSRSVSSASASPSAAACVAAANARVYSPPACSLMTDAIGDGVRAADTALRSGASQICERSVGTDG